MEIGGAYLVDAVLVLALIFYVLRHIGHGFLVLASRLLAFAGSIVLAFFLYGPVADFFTARTSIPPGILDAVSFITLFVIVQVILEWVISSLFSLLPEEFNSSLPARVLAAVPAFVDGLILASLTLLVLLVIPLWPGIKGPIESSRIGSSLVNTAAGMEIYVDRVFGQATQETLGFLTVRPGEDETLVLPFEAKSLAVDEEAEAQMLSLINKERAKVGAPPLVIDEEAREVAREHSEDMWVRKYFSHTNPDGEDPFDRMREGGVRFSEAGENLALARTVERAHQGLMNSPGHKRNILDPDFGRVGIGVVDGGIYGMMFTQNFAD